MKKSFATTFLTIMLMLSFSIELTAQLRGEGLMIAPTRLEFDKKTRSAELTLTNFGKVTNSFRIQAINMRMNETGQQQKVTGKPLEGEYFADKLVRFAPRQVRLKPGEQQTIRIMAKMPTSLEDAEYRTGLNFQWIPEAGSPDIGKKESATDGISVNIQFSYGVTIPVIIRKGELKVSGKISSLEIKATNTTEPYVEIMIERIGNRSLYGDFSVVAVKKNGKTYPLNSIKGVAVYVPNPRRIFSIPLPADSLKQAKDNNESIRVEYREPSKNGGKLIAQKEISFK